ncbi:hypothetical protein A1342_03000 [Methylomonas methanica]|nr:hypothetical protein A1342_03000 [Methylomonas methanica]
MIGCHARRDEGIQGQGWWLCFCVLELVDPNIGKACSFSLREKARMRGPEGVANATGFVEVGSRPDSRVTFLCLAKEKLPKEKPPGIPPISCASRFWRGFSEGASQPLRKRAASLPLPCGLISPKTVMLGAE